VQILDTGLKFADYHGFRELFFFTRGKPKLKFLTVAVNPIQPARFNIPVIFRLMTPVLGIAVTEPRRPARVLSEKNDQVRAILGINKHETSGIQSRTRSVCWLITQVSRRAEPDKTDNILSLY
jgi:hypothetical protein